MVRMTARNAQCYVRGDNVKLLKRKRAHGYCESGYAVNGSSSMSSPVRPQYSSRVFAKLIRDRGS